MVEGLYSSYQLDIRYLAIYLAILEFSFLLKWWIGLDGFERLLPVLGSWILDEWMKKLQGKPCILASSVTHRDTYLKLYMIPSVFATEWEK